MTLSPNPTAPPTPAADFDKHLLASPTSRPFLCSAAYRGSSALHSLKLPQPRKPGWRHTEQRSSKEQPRRTYVRTYVHCLLSTRSPSADSTGGRRWWYSQEGRGGGRGSGGRAGEGTVPAKSLKFSGDFAEVTSLRRPCMPARGWREPLLLLLLARWERKPPGLVQLSRRRLRGMRLSDRPIRKLFLSHMG